MSALSQQSLPEFCSFLASEQIRRFYLVWDAEQHKVVVSHPALQPLATLLELDERDFDAHEGFFVQVAPETGVLQGACVHRTCRGQGAGGLRYWRYDTVEDYLRDGLRLARGMTHKNALAGLWWGGGKGVMARGTGEPPDNPSVRRRIYQEYGELISSLRGAYVTAEDVGTSVEDMEAVSSRTRHTTCIPEAHGGSGNPSEPTARGVVRGMEAALAFLGQGSLAGKSVAVQGLGHVGEPLVRLLLDRQVATVIGSDIDAQQVDAVHRRFADQRLEVRVAARGDDSILAEPVDILSPCAVGGILNPESIARLRATIVCGAANNQLEDPRRDDRRLRASGVTYLPDFLVNRMGIVNCADEQYGRILHDPAIERHLGQTWENSIFNLTQTVLRKAHDSARTPGEVALELAEQRSFEPHPIWGHRGAQIIDSLVRGGWTDR